MTASPNQQTRAASRRDFRIVIMLVLLAAIAGACVTPFGGWVQSFFFGTGVRWSNAYVALETAEANLPRNERDRERLLIVTAMTEGEAPIGFKLGPRLHPVGTLAHLRYETFDENDVSMNTWEVRTLVPTLGSLEGPEWKPCGTSCREEIARSTGTVIRRSGEAGIAEEWVLRMPVGRPFNLKPTSLQTHDILDTRAHRMSLSSIKVDNKSVPLPAKILVTLIKACPADVRVGTTMNVSFDRYSTVPLPTGFTVSRWVQLDGCGKLEPFPPPPPDPPINWTTAVRVEPPDLHAVIAQRDVKTGFVALKVDERWLQKHNMPVVFTLNLLCRYDAAMDKWQLLPRPNPPVSSRLVPGTDADVAYGNRVIYEVQKEPALMWLHWLEQKEVNAVERLTVYREATVVSGPVQCNDVSLGPPPPGKVALCVPFADRAEARFVPEPKKACSQ